MDELFKVAKGPDWEELSASYLFNLVVTFDFSSGQTRGIQGYICLISDAYASIRSRALPADVTRNFKQLAFDERRPGVKSSRTLHYIIVESVHNSRVAMHGFYNCASGEGLFMRLNNDIHARPGVDPET